MWRPARRERKTVKASKRSSKAALESVKAKISTVKADNPFRHYRSNETLGIRCQNDLTQLFTKYDGRFRSAEVFHNFSDLVHEQYAESFFTYNPMVLVLGRKGSGKTTFVNWLLGWDHYPISHESQKQKKASGAHHHHPVLRSTDHFTILEQDNIAPKIDGARVVDNDSKPYARVLRPFQPEINTSLVLCSYKESALLRDVTIIDTPCTSTKTAGSSGKHFISDVTETLCFTCDRIYVVVDAQRGLINTEDSISSEEIVELSYQLLGDEKKVAIVITKCESLTAEQATILEHRVVWAFSKLLDTDLCPTVFFGAFENTALPPEADKNLIDQWHQDIYNEFYHMQRHKVLHVADSLILRGQQLICLSFVVRLIIAKRTYFRKHFILKHLGKIFSAAQEICKRPINEFPSMELVHQRLLEMDINTLQLPSGSMMQDIEKMIYREIPEIVEDHMRKMRYMLEDVRYSPSFSLKLDNALEDMKSLDLN
ncbi:EH domain-containing protein 3-like isoform X1 [Convolutriloba macropyga]|uniref:EH domain-containing protein 3-like isoform X1 n=1 Tax=Convolutriloba macropyga TaxID=536237 RepID=UPI003F52278C